MLDEAIVAAIVAGIISVLGLTFKHIKTSHCWSKEACCDCVSRSNRESVIIHQPVITSTQI